MNSTTRSTKIWFNRDSPRPPPRVISHRSQCLTKPLSRTSTKILVARLIALGRWAAQPAWAKPHAKLHQNVMSISGVTPSFHGAPQTLSHRTLNHVAPHPCVGQRAALPQRTSHWHARDQIIQPAASTTFKKRNPKLKLPVLRDLTFLALRTPLLA